jgi:hypothetical protein
MLGLQIAVTSVDMLIARGRSDGERDKETRQRNGPQLPRNTLE